jgi:hypothetical protein
MKLRKLLLLGTVSVVLIRVGSARSAGDPPVNEQKALAKGLACLVGQKWVQDDLHGIGLSVGEIALLRYRFGPVPGISPVAPHLVSVSIYTPDEKKAWLLFFRYDPDRGITAVRNGYHLVRGEDGTWSAGEGNGGVATYRAISAYATELAKQPAVRMELKLSKDVCLTDE